MGESVQITSEGKVQRFGSIIKLKRFVCDGTVSVDAHLTVTANGSCSSGINVTTTVPGDVTGSSMVFNTEVGVSPGTAHICHGGGLNISGGTGGNLHFACGASTLDFANFVSTLLGRVTVAGDIYGDDFGVGDWVFLVGAMSYDSGSLGACGACTGTFVAASVHPVSPDVSNSIELTEGGVTTTLELTFTVL